MRFHIGDVPVQLRLGDQVVNWGESSFLRFGVDTINPLNLVALPAGNHNGICLFPGMLWGRRKITENVS